MKKAVFCLLFLLLSTWVYAGNCLKYVGNALKANGSQGVDSILSLPDNKGNYTNQALITINRNNSDDIDTYISMVALSEIPNSDNVSFSFYTQSLLDPKFLNLTLDNNSYAESYLKGFFNTAAIGYTNVFTNYEVKNSYVWSLMQDFTFNSIEFPELDILDIGISSDDSSAFYVLVFDKAASSYKILKVNANLTEKTLVYTLNASGPNNSGIGQIFYDIDEDDGAEIDLLVKVTENNVNKNLFIRFTEKDGEINFAEPEDFSDEFGSNVDKINKYLTSFSLCENNSETDYDIFKYDFDSISFYKDDDENSSSEFVSTLSLWDPSYATVVGNVAYITHYGGGMQAVNVSNPETIDNTSVIGDTINDFFGLPQQVQPMVLNGNLYMAVAGGWAGLGVFKANDCYENFSLQNVFKDNPCNDTTNDNSSPTQDNGTDTGDTTCSGCFTADDVSFLSAGWSLAGTGCDITDMSIFAGVNTVWKWTGSAWAVYSPKDTISTLLNNYGITPVTIIHAKEGFWINK